MLSTCQGPSLRKISLILTKPNLCMCVSLACSIQAAICLGEVLLLSKYHQGKCLNVQKMEKQQQKLRSLFSVFTPSYMAPSQKSLKVVLEYNWVSTEKQFALVAKNKNNNKINKKIVEFLFKQLHTVLLTPSCAGPCCLPEAMLTKSVSVFPWV